MITFVLKIFSILFEVKMVKNYYMITGVGLKFNITNILTFDIKHIFHITYIKEKYIGRMLLTFQRY